jgi:hypothetical protein
VGAQASSYKLEIKHYDHRLQSHACDARDNAKQASDSDAEAKYNGQADGLSAASNHLHTHGFNIPPASCPPSVKSNRKKVSFPFKDELSWQRKQYCKARQFGKEAPDNAAYYSGYAGGMKQARTWLGKIFSNQGGKVPKLSC